MQDRATPPIPQHPDVVLESTRRVWSGRFPLDQVKFRNRRFDGSLSATRTWELWRRGAAAALIPYDPWTDRLALIEQFRFPALAAGFDPVLVEFPAGLCEDGESAEVTIRREIQEEMHLQADLLEPIGRFMLSAGGADENCMLFAGRIHAPAAGPDGIAGYGGEASESEDIRVRVLSADAAIEAAFTGQYANMLTTLGLFWLAAQRDRLRQQWTTS